MRRHHSGSGRRHVFPHGWQTRHAAVVTDTIVTGDGATSRVKIRTPTSGATEWDPVDRVSKAVPGEPVYDGPATITALAAGDPRVEAVAEQVPTRVYEVALPWTTASIGTEHVIDVADDDPDPLLAGRRLTIDHVERGTRRFSRLLTATLTH